MYEKIKKIEKNACRDSSLNCIGKDNFGKEVSNRVYFYQRQAGDYKKTKKMILLK
jgi:hypothetical protein